MRPLTSATTLSCADAKLEAVRGKTEGGNKGKDGLETETGSPTECEEDEPVKEGGAVSNAGVARWTADRGEKETAETFWGGIPGNTCLEEPRLVGAKSET